MGKVVFYDVQVMEGFCLCKAESVNNLPENKRYCHSNLSIIDTSFTHPDSVLLGNSLTMFIKNHIIVPLLSS